MCPGLCFVCVYAFFTSLVCYWVYTSLDGHWKTSKAINFLQANAVEVGCAANPQNIGLLVFMSCPVTNLPVLSDSPELPEPVRALLSGRKRIIALELQQRTTFYSYAEVHYAKGPDRCLKIWRSEGDYDCDGQPVGSKLNPDVHMPSNFKSRRIVAAATAVIVGGGSEIGDGFGNSEGYFLTPHMRDQLIGASQPTGERIFFPHLATASYPFGTPNIEPQYLDVGRHGHTVETCSPLRTCKIGDVRASFDIYRPTHISLFGVLFSSGDLGSSNYADDALGAQQQSGDSFWPDAPAHLSRFGLHYPSQVQAVFWNGKTYSEIKVVFDGKMSMADCLDKMGRDDPIANAVLGAFFAGGFAFMGLSLIKEEAGDCLSKLMFFLLVFVNFLVAQFGIFTFSCLCFVGCNAAFLPGFCYFTSQAVRMRRVEETQAQHVEPLLACAT